MVRLIIALYALAAGLFLFSFMLPDEPDILPEKVAGSLTVSHEVRGAVTAPASVPGLFAQVSREFNLPTSLLAAICQQESRFHPWAVNVEGQAYYPSSKQEALRVIARNAGRSYDSGLMQINVFWLKKYQLDPATAIEPETNIRLAAWILRQCFDKYGVNWRAVGAYHTGDPNRRFFRSMDYALNIMRHYDRIEVRRKTMTLEAAIAPRSMQGPGG